MKETKGTLWALCACEWLYHLYKDKERGVPTLSEADMLAVLGPIKSKFIRHTLGEQYRPLYYLEDAACCSIAKTPSNELILAFRGTVPFELDLSSLKRSKRSFESIKDGMRNLFLQFMGGDMISKQYGQGSKVHEGFHYETEKMWPFILKSIQELDPEGCCPITICGHSQGGAIAFLTALRLCNEAATSNHQNLILAAQRIKQILSFGAPQAGDIGFANNYKKIYAFKSPTKKDSTDVLICLDALTYRYEKAGDCIPFVPYKAKDLASLLRHRYAYLPISTHFIQVGVDKFRGLLEQYVPVGQLRYINYRDQSIERHRSYELRLADLYLAWAEKGKEGAIFSIHFLFEDDGYAQQYLQALP